MESVTKAKAAFRRVMVKPKRCVTYRMSQRTKLKPGPFSWQCLFSGGALAD